MKQQRKTWSLVLLFGGILWLSASGLAAAQEKERSRRQGPPVPDAMLERFDANGDGVLTKDELPERAQQRFERMDANGDGQVSRDELGRRGGGERDPEARFKRHDANGDGLLSVDELPEERGVRMIEKLDQDGDGALSREEVAAGERRGRERTRGGREKKQDSPGL